MAPTEGIVPRHLSSPEEFHWMLHEGQWALVCGARNERVYVGNANQEISIESFGDLFNPRMPADCKSAHATAIWEGGVTR